MIRLVTLPCNKWSCQLDAGGTFLFLKIIKEIQNLLLKDDFYPKISIYHNKQYPKGNGGFYIF